MFSTMDRFSHRPLPEIWAVDWRGSERARRILGSWVRRSRSPARSPAAAFVYAPGGSHGPLDAVLEGVEILDSAELLQGPEGAEVDAWTSRRAAEILEGQVLPREGALDFDRLNLLDLQDALQRYRTFLTCLQALAHAHGADRIRFFSFDAALSAALEAGLSREGLDVRSSRVVRMARQVQERFQARSGAAPRSPSGGNGRPEALPPTLGLEGSGGALAVSWTRPMLEMFEQVGPPVTRRGIPWTHLHYGATEGADGATDGADHVRVLDVMAAARAEIRADCFRGWPGVAQSLAERFHSEPEYPILRSHARELHTWFLDLQAAHGRVVERLLRQSGPGVVLVGNDRWWTGQTWIQLARELAIPTLGLQDGIAAASAQWDWITADRVGLMGANVEDCLRGAGVASERIVVTGQPRYDRLLARTGAEERRATRARLGVSEDARVVIFATQYSQDPSFVEEVCAAILQAPDVFLLLRPHPSGGDDVHRSVAERFGPERVSLQRTARIDDLLVAGDVVVVQHSTVAFEADLLGRRVILADFSGEPEPQYTQGVRALRAHAPDEVARGVAQAFAEGPLEPGGAEAIRYFVGPTDGQAGERVALLVEDLLAEAGSE
jgi:hypothetical protein